MIDEYITRFQLGLAIKSNEFFCRKKSENSRLAYGAYLIVPVVVGLTGSLDYIKLLAACVEEIAKMVFLFPTRFFSPRLAKRVTKHYRDAKDYGVHLIYKIVYGALKDLGGIRQSMADPFLTVNLQFSFYGCESRPSNEWERMHLSLLDAKA